jgi:tight adherence protein B
MTATALAAALVAGAAGHLLAGHAPGVRASAARTRPSAAAVTVPLVGAGVAAVLLLDGTRVVLVVVGLAVVAAGSRDLARRRRTAAADRRAELVLVVCDSLVADLRAGQPPVTALAAAAEDWTELAPVASAARLGAGVPAALRVLATRPGGAQLRVLAAAWEVGHRTGAGLAGALAMAADQLRADRATARVVATEMAAAQATARLLALLPVAVLVLGKSLGGDPFGFLLDSPPGLACLCAGLSLEYAGLLWLARIADHVTGRR